MKIELNELRNSPSAEHVLNIFKAVLATVPFAGGISSLISDYIPSQRQVRLEAFTKDVANDLFRFQSDVDKKYISTEEFAFIFEKCFKGALENYQQEKIDSFKAILINSLTNSHVEQNEKEYYLNLVNNLSALHIQVLSFMASPHEYLKKRGIEESKIQGGFKDFFPIVISNVKLEIIKMAFQDLYNNGFLTTDSNIFSTMTVNSGWDLLGDRVSTSGREFIEFITLAD